MTPVSSCRDDDGINIRKALRMQPDTQNILQVFAHAPRPQLSHPRRRATLGVVAPWPPAIFQRPRESQPKGTGVARPPFLLPWPTSWMDASRDTPVAVSLAIT